MSKRRKSTSTLLIESMFGKALKPSGTSYSYAPPPPKFTVTKGKGKPTKNTPGENLGDMYLDLKADILYVFTGKFWCEANHVDRPAELPPKSKSLSPAQHILRKFDLKSLST